MKPYFLLFLLPTAAMAQWNTTGDNSTTGSVTASSLTTTANYGLNLAPQTGDAVIRRSNPGSLMISSNGGESEIRLNYNYGGGSGGISVYDGGTFNHGNLKVNSGGHLVVSSSGGFVGIGTDDPKYALSVKGVINAEANGDYYGAWFGGESRTDKPSVNVGAWYNNKGSIYWNSNRLFFRTQVSNTEVFENNLVLDKGKVGIGTSEPVTELDVRGGITVQSNNNVQWGGAFGPGIPTISAAINSGLFFYPTGSTSGIAMRIHPSGYVGIGTTDPDSRLTVKGDIHAQEVRVDLTGATAPDYVFEKGYELMSLSELEKYIQRKNHLPEIPSSSEMELNGINLKEINLLLLRKVEELTLHLIEQSKRIDDVEAENQRLKALVTRR